MKHKNKNRKFVVSLNVSDMTATGSPGSYEKAFLSTETIQKRGNKSMYLSEEYHERLTRIVQVIGSDKIPLFAYLNNIIEHHFQVFEGDITKEFKEKYKALF